MDHGEGQWTSWKMCPDFSGVNEYKVRQVPYLGAWPWQDDTSLDGIRLKCKYNNGTLAR